VAGQPDLFVVCKSCGSEVSPYITECPYCGSRLRKRAPKLDKGGVPKPAKARRRPSAPSLSRLRPGEMPGIRTEGKPYATLALVLGSIVFTILVRSGILDLADYVVAGPVGNDWYRPITTTFVYASTAYEVCALGAVFVFGWLLERRHGFFAPLIVFALGTAAGAAFALAVDSDALMTGANAGALALLAAWAVRDLQALRHNQAVESDMLGVAAVAVLLLLLPVALYEPHPLAGLGGGIAGLVLGHLLARLRER
jgi:membrane associated rhomboid family serine protease